MWGGGAAQLSRIFDINAITAKLKELGKGGHDYELWNQLKVQGRCLFCAQTSEKKKKEEEEEDDDDDYEDELEEEEDDHDDDDDDDELEEEEEEY